MMETEERRRRIAQDVSYERAMLCWTYAALRKHIGDVVEGDAGTPLLAARFFFGTSLEEPGGSALLEPFLLHVRNLRDFLYRNTAKEDDVLAVHFFDESTDWTRNRPPLGPELQKTWDRLNKTLAHITYARLAYRERRQWDAGQIKRELDVTWEAFLHALPEDKRQWFATWRRYEL